MHVSHCFFAIFSHQKCPIRFIYYGSPFGNQPIAMGKPIDGVFLGKWWKMCSNSGYSSMPCLIATRYHMFSPFSHQTKSILGRPSCYASICTESGAQCKGGKNDWRYRETMKHTSYKSKEAGQMASWAMSVVAWDLRCFFELCICFGSRNPGFQCFLKSSGSSIAHGTPSPCSMWHLCVTASIHGRAWMAPNSAHINGPP